MGPGPPDPPGWGLGVGLTISPRKLWRRSIMEAKARIGLYANEEEKDYSDKITEM